jgi:alpha-tubulin suppressor-like RCC1 family protein
MNPYDPSKTNMALTLRSPRIVPITEKSYSDTLGDSIRIGAAAYLMQNIDSTRIDIVSMPATPDTSFKITFSNFRISNDTVWCGYFLGDSGMKTIKITAYVKNNLMVSDSVTLMIYPKSIPLDTTMPVLHLVSPVKDSGVVSTGAPTIFLSCKDASGIASVICTTGIFRFSGIQSTTADSIWSINVTGLTPGRFNIISFIATDKSASANRDTLSVYIKYDNDSTAPAMSLYLPVKDSISENSTSCSVKVVIKDASGISRVSCNLGGSQFASKRPGVGDSIWSFGISGLAPGYNTVRFFAIDSSINANMDSLVLHIKFDPNSKDSEGPAFIRVGGPVSGNVVKDSIVSIVDSVFDPSGVDSVFWTLNGIRRGMLSIGSNGLYSLKDTLRKFHLDTIVIHAQDKSSIRNKSKIEVVLDYNLPPIVNDTNVMTLKNTAISWTMHAISPDNDSLTWSIVFSPQATSGAVNGILPSLTFTPQNNWAGIDSMLIRVTDGAWSDTAKVKIALVDNPVGPKDVKIVLQPASDSVILGKPVVLSISLNADVNPAPTYQWYLNGAEISGATALTYPLGSVAVKDAGAYTAKATNSQGSAVSPAVMVTVIVPPSISTQPEAQEKCNGDKATFAVVVLGTEPMTYQWKKNGAAISGGANEATFSIASVNASDSESYCCVVTNKAGNIASQSVKLTIKTAPAIMTHPAAIAKCVGQTASFTINASGTAPLSYKWKKNGIDIASGADAATYTITSITLSDSGSYTCFVNNDCGTGLTSNAAKLTVNIPPTITLQPVAQTKWAGDSVRFTIKAAGSAPLSYQWKKGNSNIPGATSDSYLISHIYYSTDHDAEFSCVVNNGCGIEVASNMAKLTVDAVKMASGGFDHSLILKTDGTLWACGNNQFGEIGDGTTINQFTPINILSNVSNICASTDYNLIVKNDGTLWAWGTNGYGNLGDGTDTDRKSPVKITADVLSIAASGSTSFIIKNGNSLWAFGDNSSGQFGLGDSAVRFCFSPTYVLSDVIKIATSGVHSIILKSDGKAFACGLNGQGQLGDGTFIDKVTPVQIMADVSEIAVCQHNSLYLKTNGTLWASGWNIVGQFGISTLGYYENPVQVNSNVFKIAVGYTFSLILKTDGSLWGCGDQVGDGTAEQRHAPIQISSDVSNIAAGSYFGFIIKTDGSLWAFGKNEYSQLGDGTTDDHLAPVPIRW